MALADLKAKWAALRPATRQKFTVSIIVGGLAVGGMLLSMGPEKETPASKNKPVERKAIALDQKILERTMTTQQAKQAEEMEEMRNTIRTLQNGSATTPPVGTKTAAMLTPTTSPSKDVGAILLGMDKEKAPSQMQPAQSLRKQTLPPPPIPQALPEPPSPTKKAKGKMPLPPPLPSDQGGLPPAQTGQQHQNIPPPIESLGDIEIASNSPAKDAKGVQAGDKKKAKRSVYLPPSFMEATLISGLNAPTAEGARGNPVPVLIRVKELAILPNQVKSNLKGCFVIAEGVGNLADERAHLRLVSLSCISKGGESVIDSKIKGFAVDADGKLGLSGRVVSKMGAVLARTLMAGFFGGVGDALKSSGATTSVSALGTSTTQSVEPGQIALAGAGAGVASSAKELQKFYLELAKQTMPVIEIGATKKITIVIQEGINLDIKTIKTAPAF